MSKPTYNNYPLGHFSRNIFPYEPHKEIKNFCYPFFYMSLSSYWIAQTGNRLSDQWITKDAWVLKDNGVLHIPKRGVDALEKP